METLEQAGKLARVFSYPVDVLIWCKDALVWLVVLPFQVLAEAVAKLARARDFSVDSFSGLLSWLHSLPSSLLGVLLDTYNKSLTTIGNASRRRANQVLTALSLMETAEQVGVVVTRLWDTVNLAVGDWAIRTEYSLVVLTRPLRRLYTRLPVIRYGDYIEELRTSVGPGWNQANATVATAAIVVEEEFLRAPWIFVSSKLKDGSRISQDIWERTYPMRQEIFVTKPMAIYKASNHYVERFGLLLERLLQSAFNGTAKEG